MPSRPTRPILKCQQQDSDAQPSLAPPLASPYPFPFASCSTATVRRDVLLSPHVHFPPTPTLVETHTTHSASIYDRAPIVVAENACALPDRHERDYSSPTLPSPQCRARAAAVKGSYFHPRAFEVCTPEPVPVPASQPPPLIPDMSASESSDDPDGLALTPPENMSPPISSHFGKAPAALLATPHSPEEIHTALSFLPHPASPPRERVRESGRERERIPPRPRRRPRSCSGTRTPSGLRKSSCFATPELDDGCLGGF